MPSSRLNRIAAHRTLRGHRAGHAFPRPITTRIEPLQGFYPAEGYHQDYLVHHPDAAYIEYNDLPKVENLERVFPALYNSQPVLTRSK